MHSALISTISFALSAGPVNVGSWRPPELEVAERAPVVDFEELQEIAFKYLGRPYRMGGIGSPHIDCSGFTCRVYAEAGYAIPRVSRDQVRAGVKVSLDRLAPGDLLFFVAEPGNRRITHVGMYLGRGQMIHASSGQGQVVVTDYTRRWYQDRVVAARRILPPQGTLTSSTAPRAALPEVQASEFEEHSGDSVLPMTKRLPQRLPEPSIGPELAWERATSLAARGGLYTEDGRWGFTMVPEATLYLTDVAFELTVAVPIRFPFGASADLGTLENLGDWTRFVRTLALGLPGAELELRFDRLGDLSLAGGFVVDHLAPGLAASGIPGLSVVKTPLAFVGAYRGAVTAELFVADVTDPALFGAAFGAPLGPVDFEVGLASDQQGVFAPAAPTVDQVEPARRAINAVEASARYDIYARRAWTFDVAAAGALNQAAGRAGFGGTIGGMGEFRFGGSSARAIRVGVDLSALGSGFLASLFGPTYLAARPTHFAALAASEGRVALGGSVLLRYDRLRVGAGYEDSFGGAPFDLRAHLLAELLALPVASTRVDLRLAYAARGGLLADVGGRADPTQAVRPADVLHASARIEIERWLHLDLHAENADKDYELGAGLTARFAL